jgi:hypothetical protein
MKVSYLIPIHLHYRASRMGSPPHNCMREPENIVACPCAFVLPMVMPSPYFTANALWLYYNPFYTRHEHELP